MNTSTKKPKDKDAMDEDDSDDEEQAAIEVEKRMNAYVNMYLSRASSSKRDHYKDGSVYQARKELIQEFIRVAQMKKCQNCGA